MSLQSPGAKTTNDDKPDATLPQLTEYLDADLRPIFIVPIDLSEPLPFAIVYGNEAYRHANYNASVLANRSPSLQFRTWCQSTNYWTSEYTFANQLWTAFAISDKWKCIQGSIATAARSEPEIPHRTDSPASLMVEKSNVKNQYNKIADPTAHMKLASLYKMMEMSDVGTFEYSPMGKLLRANESWYRMSLHPRGDDVYSEFSFMDLVYPADVPLVLSMWNKLTQGLPVTFEMRWKSRGYDSKSSEDRHVPGKNDDDDDDSSWILSACVPIIDETGRLVSICGNTIDIDAQKRAQKDAWQRAEALERARASELKFARFALLAPIAIFIVDSERKLSYCNDRFFELTGLSKVEDGVEVEWETAVAPEDKVAVDVEWAKLSKQKERMHAYFRLRKTWELGDGIPRQSWAEVQAFPELDSDGNVISIFGIMSDISRLKWAEEQQRIRMEGALDAKRKAENFIDITSHEMRNPLSAVLQCADSTVESLNSIRSVVATFSASGQLHSIDQVNDEIKASLDSLNTIISCSMHQKRVVDDILTLSKMDSNLIVITPVKLEPATVVAEAVHMFALECSRDAIELKFTQHSSLQESDIGYVMMDPSRVLQVLINLLTNAIKFTRNRPTKQIEVTLGANAVRPPENCPILSQINFTDIESDSDGLLEREGWGSGPISWLWITCRDTGCGLSPAEQGRLFTRFSQATPKTHIQYGGSGLGLFISKKLAELQAGAIGVNSASESGSTFAFYVGVRKAARPTDQVPKPTRRASMTTEIMAPAIPSTMSAAKDKTRYTVLVVEDNLTNQKVLSQQLRKAGCEVHVANHGMEALDFLRTTRYWHQHTPSPSSSSITQRGLASSGDPEDQPTPQTSASRSGGGQPINLSAVLMDIEMPIMDGLTCVSRIREYQAGGEISGHIPVIAVSANARSEQVAQAIEAGMDDTISKPFRISELLPKIEALVVKYGTRPATAIDQNKTLLE